ncbi:MAG: type II toxin-antitoxin system VapC family toxin [Desulfurococcales archaeon]|nr:type II toxin-antitoxin system VapC family toxin [Desulfurococcales archaeon]
MLTSVVHIAEVVNIVESRLGLQASIRLLARILELDNIKVAGVDEADYEEALGIAARYAVSVNDAVAHIKMRRHDIQEVYTFDKHFKNLPGIRVIQE